MFIIHIIYGHPKVESSRIYLILLGRAKWTILTPIHGHSQAIVRVQWNLVVDPLHGISMGSFLVDSLPIQASPGSRPLNRCPSFLVCFLVFSLIYRCRFCRCPIFFRAGLFATLNCTSSSYIELYTGTTLL